MTMRHRGGLQLKLSDFGTSVALAKMQGCYSCAWHQMSWCHTTYAYAAPECLSHRRYFFASDIFSIGLIFYELQAGELLSDQPQEAGGTQMKQQGNQYLMEQQALIRLQDKMSAVTTKLLAQDEFGTARFSPSPMLLWTPTERPTAKAPRDSALKYGAFKTPRRVENHASVL